MSLKSESPSAYGDVKTVLEHAMQHPGLLYRLKSYGAAVNFRQRCYKYMKLLREIESEQAFGVPGFRPEILFDCLIIRQIDETGEVNSKGRVLRFEQHEMTGVMIDPNTGEEIKIVTEQDE